MINLDSMRAKAMLGKSTVLLGTILLSGLPLMAQPSPDGRQPTVPREPKTRLANPPKPYDLYDPAQLAQALREELAATQVEDALQAKVAISVRDAGVQEVANAVRAAGFTVPIEIRDAYILPITLGVKDVTVSDVLTAAALFSRCEVFALKDRVLITPKASRTKEEANYVEKTKGGTYRTKVFATTLASEMIRLGKKEVNVGHLSPLLQQVAERFQNVSLAGTNRPIPKLTPDTLLTLTYRPGHDNDISHFTLNVGKPSVGPYLSLTLVDGSKMDQPTTGTGRRRP